MRTRREVDKIDSIIDNHILASVMHQSVTAALNIVLDWILTQELCGVFS